MRVVITGHTRGLGKALQDVFIKNNHEVIGFSQSTGYDISLPEVRANICSSIVDCDVFINNAYHVTGQYEMLSDIVKLWQDTSKLIVNIGSKATSASLGEIPEGDFKNFMASYVEAKKKQQDLLDARQYYPYPKIVNVIPGIIDTDMGEVLKAEKMDPQDVADLIHHIVKLKDKILIHEVKVDVPNLNFRTIKL